MQQHTQHNLTPKGQASTEDALPTNSVSDQTTKRSRHLSPRCTGAIFFVVSKDTVGIFPPGRTAFDELFRSRNSSQRDGKYVRNHCDSQLLTPWQLAPLASGREVLEGSSHLFWGALSGGSRLSDVFFFKTKCQMLIPSGGLKLCTPTLRPGQAKVLRPGQAKVLRTGQAKLLRTFTLQGWLILQWHRPLLPTPEAQGRATSSASAEGAPQHAKAPPVLNKDGHE